MNGKVLALAAAMVILCCQFNLERTIGQVVVIRKNLDYLDRLGFFEVKDFKKVNIREVENPLPLVWQFQIYHPDQKMKLATGMWNGNDFIKDKIQQQAAAPIVCKSKFILTIQIRRDQRERRKWKCYAYIVSPDFSEYVEVPIKTRTDFDKLSRSLTKYFAAARRANKAATPSPYKELKTYKKSEPVPLVLFERKTRTDNGKGAAEKSEPKYLAIWLEFEK